jgi:hypothetical protein
MKYHANKYQCVSDLWVWILLYAAALAGLHLLVYYYYIRQNDKPTWTASATGERNSPSQRSHPIGPDEDDPNPQERPPATDPSGRQCRNCGATNERDPMFRYCRECGQELSY